MIMPIPSVPALVLLKVYTALPREEETVSLMLVLLLLPLVLSVMAPDGEQMVQMAMDGTVPPSLQVLPEVPLLVSVLEQLQQTAAEALSPPPKPLPGLTIDLVLLL
jgi:hypothetical protein